MEPRLMFFTVLLLFQLLLSPTNSLIEMREKDPEFHLETEKVSKKKGDKNAIELQRKTQNFNLYFTDFLLQHVFSQCNVFFVYKSKPGLMHNLNVSDNSTMVIKKDSRGFLKKPIPFLGNLIKKSGKEIYLIDLSDFVGPQSNSTYKFQFIKSARRTSQNCALTLSFVDEEPLEFFVPFARIFFKNLKSVTRGDEDHFVFFTSERHSESLLSAPTAMEIKFKLLLFPTYAVAIKKGSKGVKGQTVTVKGVKAQSLCFFSGEKGAPKIVNIDTNLETEIKTRAEIMAQLFPDWANQGNTKVLRTPCQTRVFFIYEIQKLSDGRWIYKRGYAWRLLEAILEKYNFTYTAFPSNGGGGSGTLKNGSWNGCVRDILDNVGDIAVAVTTDVNRFKVLTGTQPMSFEYLNFMLGEPSRTYSWMSIFWPLDKIVWLGVLASIIFLVVTFNLISKDLMSNPVNMMFGDLELDLKELRAELSSDQPGRRKRRKSSSIEVVSSGHHYHPPQPLNLPPKPSCKFEKRLIENTAFILLEQNIDYPSKMTSKLLCGLWMFVALILTTAYRSKLCGLMTFPTLQNQPHSFAELAQSKNFRWGLEGASVGSSAHNFFLTSPSPLYKKIYQKMEFEPQSKKCMDRSMTSNFACMTFNGQAEFMIYRNYSSRHGKVPLKLSPDSAAHAMPGIAMRKRAIYRTNFDRVVSTTREMGVITKWKWLDFARERMKHWKWLQRNRALGIPDEDAESNLVDDANPTLTLQNLKGPFFLLIAGNICGIFVCLQEYIQKKEMRVIKRILKIISFGFISTSDDELESKQLTRSSGSQLPDFGANFPSAFPKSEDGTQKSGATNNVNRPHSMHNLLRREGQPKKFRNALARGLRR